MSEPEAESGGLKRAAEDPPTEEPEPTRKRQPYASKACDACRKRKGKCDGQQPCEYCCTKGLICVFTVTQAEWRRPSSLNRPRPEGNLSEVFTFIANLQGQLNALNSLVSSAAQGDASGEDAAAKHTRTDLSSLPKELLSIQVRANAAGRGLSRFFGATSPQFSLKTAKSALQPDPGSSTSQESQPYSNGLTADDDDESETSSDEEDEPQRIATQQRQQKLLRFREDRTLQETTRLLHVYEDVIGNFHPMIPLSQLTDNAKTCYATQDSGQQSKAPTELEQDDLIMLNLALAIALATESSPSSKRGCAMLRNCRELFSIRIASSKADINLVIIALLMAFYHFFRDNVVVAWRLCGVAGSLSQELGLHTDEVSALSTPEERTLFGVIISSIIVLDKQWAAASGLPVNFTNTSFDKSLTSEVEIPYLRAMLAFCTMADKVAQPISEAAKGHVCKDDENFDISNYQVESWRKKTLNDQNFIHPKDWSTKGASLVPWTILIYLRANTIRKLLLRPFFLPNARLDVAKRNMDTGLDIVSETIDSLDWLDKNTTIYRQLHPHFQHLLASACALLSLIVAFVCKHRAQMSAEMLQKVGQLVKLKYHCSLKLAAKYKSSFRASKRLWKHLFSMEEPFQLQGFLPGSPPISIPAAQKPSLPNESASVPQQVVPDPSSWHRFFPPPFEGLDFGDQRVLDLPVDESAKWLNSFDEDLLAFGDADLSWPLNDAANFF